MVQTPLLQGVIVGGVMLLCAAWSYTLMRIRDFHNEEGKGSIKVGGWSHTCKIWEMRLHDFRASCEPRELTLKDDGFGIFIIVNQFHRIPKPTLNRPTFVSAYTIIHSHAHICSIVYIPNLLRQYVCWAIVTYIDVQNHQLGCKLVPANICGIAVLPVKQYLSVLWLIKKLTNK